MLTESSAKKLNQAILKLMKVIGNPDWYQAVSSDTAGSNMSIILHVNRMIDAETIKYNVPLDIDGIPVKLRYRNQLARFYGHDGPSTH